MCWNPRLQSLTPYLFLPVYLHVNVGLPSLQATASPSPPAAALLQVLSTWLPISTPLAGLDECFFFNSLVVGLPYTSIFCQFWLFLFVNLLLSLFWLYEVAQCVYLCLHLGGKSPISCLSYNRHPEKYTMISHCVFDLPIFQLGYLLFCY